MFVKSAVMHQIADARYITEHRSSIIVLCHFVHRAYVLEALFKREEKRGTITPLEQKVLVNSTREVENASLIQN